jgi:hypothetical protein
MLFSSASRRDLEMRVETPKPRSHFRSCQTAAPLGFVVRFTISVT